MKAALQVEFQGSCSQSSISSAPHFLGRTQQSLLWANLKETKAILDSSWF